MFSGSIRRLSAGPLVFVCAWLSLDRFYVLGPVVLWLARPRLYRSPIRWLTLAAVLAGFAVLYNVPVGGALLIGLLPAFFQEALRAWRGGFARVRPLLVAAAAVLVVIVAVPWARHTVTAFVQFASENGLVNTTANDIPWSGIPDVPSPSPEAITTSLLFSALKFGWIPIALLALALLVNTAPYTTGLRAWVSSLSRVRNRLLWAVALACVCMLPWTAGRIDPGMSRTGPFSAYCAGRVPAPDRHALQSTAERALCRHRRFTRIVCVRNGHGLGPATRAISLGPGHPRSE